jgi:hypothetical protein
MLLYVVRLNGQCLLFETLLITQHHGLPLMNQSKKIFSFSFFDFFVIEPFESLRINNAMIMELRYLFNWVPAHIQFLQMLHRL